MNLNTRVARYVSGLIMKMGIYMLKNPFIVFQSIVKHDALKPLVEALFPLRLRHLQNISERFKRFFRQRKSLTTHFFFLLYRQTKILVHQCALVVIIHVENAHNSYFLMYIMYSYNNFIQNIIQKIIHFFRYIQ